MKDKIMLQLVAGLFKKVFSLNMSEIMRMIEQKVSNLLPIASEIGAIIQLNY